MAKLRIYELARELGVDSKQVMVALQANGEFVRSAASAIEPDAAQAVRERLRRQPGGEERRPGRRPYREFVPGATGLARVIPREARPPGAAGPHGGDQGSGAPRTAHRREQGGGGSYS